MMRYDKIPSDLFTKNRARFTKYMKPNSIAIFYANDIMPRSADSHHIYRPNPDLYYLTGVAQEETYLILYPGAANPAQKEMLFIRETNEHIAVWEGDKLTKESGSELSGVKSVYWNDKLDTIIASLINYVDNIYLNLNENDRSGSNVPVMEQRMVAKMKEKYPLHNFERSAPIMSSLRAIKQPAEISVIQKACDITEKAFRQVLKTVKPGMMEYEVEAEIISSFIRHGAEGHAYEPIVASGFNACILHYKENYQKCNDGDLLLMDFGSNYAHYASDLSRTIPVNGKFSPRQKEVYNACLSVHNEAKQMMRPGVTLNEFNAEIRIVMESALTDIGLIDKSATDKEKKQLTQKYFPHGTSHFMGIDVHDIGDRFGKIEENMCFTIEPGIYIREENLGIRIENDIIVNSNGNIDLMKNIPITVEEIEDLMA